MIPGVFARARSESFRRTRSAAYYQCHEPMSIERIKAPSLATFQREFQNRARPVILTGLMDDWPARSWTLDVLRERYGHRRVTAVRTRDGQVVHGARDGIPYHSILFGEYLDMLESETLPSYYMVFPISEVLPELMREFVLPEYCRDAAWSRARFWLSAANTGSPLHRDPPDNLYAQIFGRKRFVLFAPEESRNLYPHAMWSGLPDFSRADATRPDYGRFPRMRDARRIECEVGAGEVLYLPRYWWHQVTSLEQSASVSLWWAQGARAALAYAGQAFTKLRRLSL